MVRVWLEEGPEGGWAWRGYLREVRSGEGSYFRSLSEMATLLEARTGVPFPLEATPSTEAEPQRRRVP